MDREPINEQAGYRPDDLAGGRLLHLAKEHLIELSDLNQLVSSFHILCEWLLIVAAAAVCRRYWNPLLYIVTVAFIGARQHGLLILMHDGAHYRLYRNRALNDWVSEIFLAWPNLVTMRSYRRHHFAHHRYLNTGRDPDWVRKKDDPNWHFPKCWTDLTWLMIGETTGRGFVSSLRLASSMASQDTGAPPAFNYARAGFYFAAAALITTTGAGRLFLLYWLIPLFTWLMLVLRIRSIAEHFAIGSGPGIYAQIRTTRAGLFDRWFVAPHNINYHTEHHIFPSVPFYRLPLLHRRLMSDPEFRSSVHMSDGYWGVLRECNGAMPPGNPDAR